ncbi:endonuclease/exonuclease/phosphatase family protein [Marinilabiliaceae bacterium ANBcel2]|nr:endonuclease/exonuclease/phosphatase family protein [Marinilabiliaceae bacterium ANBcel2]
MNRFVNSLTIIFTIIPAFLLICSVATAYINPSHLHIFTFAGFLFPVLWIVNLIILLWLVSRKNMLLLITLLVLALSWDHWQNTFQFNSSSRELQNLKEPVKVMSYNTRMFDFYNHSGKEGAPEKIFDFIIQQNPDIICFQEYFTSLRKEEYTPTAIKARFRQYGYKYIEYLKTHKGGTGYGLAIFSKHPITNKNAIRFENSLNLSSYADIDINGKRVRVFNNHLESIGFQDHELSYLDSLDFRMSESQKEGLRNISDKLTRAFNSRSKQAETISRHINNSPYPVIVCGDFNDTPVSYVYRTVRQDLKDAFRESGSGFGGTYNGKLPSFRIDYIFHSPQFKSYNFSRFKLGYSDHFPIMTTIDIKN